MRSNLSLQRFGWPARLLVINAVKKISELTFFGKFYADRIQFERVQEFPGGYIASWSFDSSNWGKCGREK